MIENEDINRSPATREANCRELAALDWAKTPSRTIQEKFKVSVQTLSHWRDSEEYKETVEELRASWREMIGRLPDTPELRRKISLGMVYSLDRLLEILVPDGKVSAKDRISAARLMAQMDGRFLSGEESGEDEKAGRNIESVAQELVAAIKRERVN